MPSAHTLLSSWNMPTQAAPSSVPAPIHNMLASKQSLCLQYTAVKPQGHLSNVVHVARLDSNLSSTAVSAKAVRLQLYSPECMIQQHIKLLLGCVTNSINSTGSRCQSKDIGGSAGSLVAVVVVG